MSDRPDRPPPTADDTRVTVVLVHGLLRTPRSLHWLARALDRAGFRVERFGYSSTRGAIAEHGQRLAAELRRLVAERPLGALHLVAHSLGNLVVRAALDGTARPRIGRVVMLVPPNRGSPVARVLARWLGGFVPVLRELSDDPAASVHRLPAPLDAEVGVIAARFDHLVPESSTHLPGERDHVRLPAFHTSVLWNRGVAQRVIEFLSSGRFGAGERP